MNIELHVAGKGDYTDVLNISEKECINFLKIWNKRGIYNINNLKGQIYSSFDLNKYRCFKIDNRDNE